MPDAYVRRVLINRNYALFMGGSFVSALGSWFQGVAIGWLVLDLSDSPFVLGLANFAQMAPLFFLGFAGGVLADRVDRRSLLLGGMAVGMAAVSLLAALALAGQASVPAILAASLLLGLTNAVVWPAWQPFIKDLVPLDRLREAIAFNSARFNLTRVLGPALAGVLLAGFGAPFCLAIAALSSAGVLIATWLIRRPRTPRARPAPWLSALDEGVRYVRGDGFTLRLLLVTGAYGFLVLPYQAFLPAFARDVLRTGAEGLGALLTAVGIGAVLGALLTGTQAVADQPGRSMALFALAGGSGLAAFAVATPANGYPAWMAMPSLVMVGLGSIGYLTTANSTLQLRVPDALVGRVMGLWVVVNAGTAPLGSLALGSAAERFGLPLVVFWCGLVGIGIGVSALLTGAFADTPDEALAIPVVARSEDAAAS
ncbi:MAG: MFS transporter [Chloroflexota bacterium]